jgi:adenine-specific DNA-methyltransferase
MSESLHDHLPLSPDLNAERLAILKTLLPDIFSNDGRLNIDELKKVVDPSLVSETERYDFRWYGKTHSKREAFTPSRASLVYDEARSINPDKANGNMIIEGENLEVLKLLTSAYRERIKCIYIDPPYNTGSDFVYSDRFTESQKPYWEDTHVTEAGVRIDTNTASDGRFHSNWLSMMQSRLLVARYLLQPDGVIFVSIDDNEVHNLRRVMDEVFGDDNFIAQMIWEGAFKNDARQIGVNHEYVLVYARERFKLPAEWSIAKEAVEPVLAEVARLKDRFGDDYDAASEALGAWFQNNKATPSFAHRRFRYIDKRGNYKEDDPTAPGGRRFDLVNPKTGRVIPLRPNRGWAFDQATFNEMVEQERVSFVTEDSIMVRRYLHETDRMTPQSVFYQPARSASERLKRLMGAMMFDFPKDENVLRQLFDMSTDKHSIILDFFAGSGTTAQAVMELNKTDGGSRECILVQLPEQVADDSAAHKAGYKTISDITIERIKRVVAREQEAAKDLLQTDAQWQFADSLGFKVLKLSKSAFPRVDFAPDPAKTEQENIQLLMEYIRAKEATFDLQFEKGKVIDEILLKNGFMLDYKLQRQPQFASNEVFLAQDRYKAALICLDAKLEPETIDYFKGHKEQFFICLELALDTTKKWNLKHHLGDKLKAF